MRRILSPVGVGLGMFIVSAVICLLGIAFGPWRHPAPVFGSEVRPPAYNTVLNNAVALLKRTNLNLVNSGCSDNVGTFSTDCTLAKLTVVANVGALPAAGCNPGDLAIVNAATLGQQIYENSGSGACVWTQQAGGAAGGGGLTIYSSPAQAFAAGTVFIPAGGGGSFNATESAVQIGAPQAATITNMFAQVSTALPGATSLALTWRKNGGSQSVTCTIAAAGTTCNDTTHSFGVSQGDLVDIQIVVTGAVGSEVLQVSTQFGTIGSNGTVNTGTINQTAFYAAAGTAVSGGGPGAAGQVWTSNGAGVAPSFQAAGGGASITRGTFGARPGCAASSVYFSTDISLVSQCNGATYFDVGYGFSGITLPSATTFTSNNVAICTITTNGFATFACPVHNGDSFNGRQIALPATPFTIDAAIRFDYMEIGGNFPTVGLYQTDGTKFDLFGVSYQNGATAESTILSYSRWNTNSTFNANVFLQGYQPGWAATVWLRWNDDGVNVNLSTSVDGQTFRAVTSFARTVFLTPTNVGWLVDPNTLTAGTGLTATLISWLVH